MPYTWNLQQTLFSTFFRCLSLSYFFLGCFIIRKDVSYKSYIFGTVRSLQKSRWHNFVTSVCRKHAETRRNKKKCLFACKDDLLSMSITAFNHVLMCEWRIFNKSHTVPRIWWQTQTENPNKNRVIFEMNDTNIIHQFIPFYMWEIKSPLKRVFFFSSCSNIRCVTISGCRWRNWLNREK